MPTNTINPKTPGSANKNPVMALRLISGMSLMDLVNFCSNNLPLVALLYTAIPPYRFVEFFQNWQNNLRMTWIPQDMVQSFPP